MNERPRSRTIKPLRYRRLDVGVNADLDAAIAKRKAAVLAALKDHLGVVSYACADAGISRSTYYNYLNDPEFRKQAEEVSEHQSDYVERKLLENIKAGKERSIIFYLKTKGKHKGYVERHEITGPDGGPIRAYTESEYPKEANMVPPEAIRAILGVAFGGEGPQLPGLKPKKPAAQKKEKDGKKKTSSQQRPKAD